MMKYCQVSVNHGKQMCQVLCEFRPSTQPWVKSLLKTGFMVALVYSCCCDITGFIVSLIILSEILLHISVSFVYTFQNITVVILGIYAC